MSEHEKRSHVGATLFSLTIGVVIGLLTAPRSGKETRDIIATRSREGLEDLEARLGSLRDELSGRIDNLRDLAATLGEEASQQSKELLTKAEVLKTDLRSSATKLAKNTGKTRQEAVTDAKRLISSGADIMQELERATKEVVKNTKAKAKETDK